ncbi:hypothetical protein C7T94_05920 [Pedobacter yulinensis]|uniref:Glycosyl transferase n=1 Tax=Pedobacter yulinensis TaxID=2126353 RepID=A0A2T3HPA0_9SPHI|nr:nucleotide disphospho-sugar-binding domain-containing protein [Pedobacter yulinensis]PST84256.1 hypothetical protein C7T94_05920 [Pedobacter yulinensis]
MQDVKNIVILLSPYISHIISTLRLMRLLAARGYRITYVNDPSLQKAVERYGFGFYGSALAKTAQGEHNAKGLHSLIDTLIDQYNPELFIAEVGFWDTAMLVRGRHKKVVMIQPWACGDRTRFGKLSPLYSYSDTRRWADYFKFEWHWAKNNLRNWYKTLTRSHTFDRYFDVIAQRAGLPAGKRLSLHNRISYPRVPGVWELILYPIELDFPRQLAPHVRFAGALIDTARKEQAFNWGLLPAGRKLVLCSLGSLSHWLQQEQRLSFYREVISAFSSLAGYVLVLNAGDLHESLLSMRLPDHIRVFRSVPQLALLEKAHLFITHGGANSIKEAAYFGVPMVVYPWSTDSDMFGNASRVKYHQLGVVGNVQTDRAADILLHINRLETGRYKENLVRIKQLFAAYQDREEEEADFVLRAG